MSNNTTVDCKKKKNLLPPNIYGKGVTTTVDTIAGGNVDKRVALTVAPKTYLRDESIFVNKVIQVLGREYYKGGTDISWMFTGTKFYGLLRSALGTTSGLIFPYTPRVSFDHKVNYQSQDITHTNITHHYYQNTPTPSLSVEAKFTADNRANALHMLSAIWYLNACSKCDFGMNTSTPGLPPPILYFSGYDTTIDNIPVLISSVNYTYPDDKHYVNLVLDMSVPYYGNEDLPMTAKSGDSKFLQEYDRKRTTPWKKWGTYDVYLDSSIHESPTRIEGDIIETGGVVSYGVDRRAGYVEQDPLVKEGGVQLSFWLPTEISISISLLVQPNVLKEQKQWTLDRYKSGLLMTNRGKNPSVVSNSKEIDVLVHDEKLNQCVMETQTVNEFYKFIPHGWTW